jgi:Zn finger protein HypA/HybF involved in hydrogenase expression
MNIQKILNDSLQGLFKIEKFSDHEKTIDFLAECDLCAHQEFVSNQDIQCPCCGDSTLKGLEGGPYEYSDF